MNQLSWWCKGEKRPLSKFLFVEIKAMIYFGMKVAQRRVFEKTFIYQFRTSRKKNIYWQ